jgi:hypothetical protein
MSGCGDGGFHGRFEGGVLNMHIATTEGAFPAISVAKNG